MARLPVGPHGLTQAEVLKPLHELWTNGNFQENWVKSVQADLEGFKTAVFDMNFSNLDRVDEKTWTEILGLPIPSTANDWLVVITALRAVVKYNEWKLHQIEKRSIQWFELTQASSPAGGN